MKLDIDPEWLKRKAEAEGNGIFSVGGLVTDIRKAEEAEREARSTMTVVPRKGKRFNYVDAVRHFASLVTLRDDPPGARRRDVTWLEGNHFGLEALGVCEAEEVESSPGVFVWRIRVVTRVVTPVVTVSRPSERVPTMPEPGDDQMAAALGLAEKMMTVRRLLDELWTQIDANVIGREAVSRLGAPLEIFYRRSGTVSTALGDMARSLADQ